MTPSELIADAIADVCDVAQAVPMRPTRLEGRMAFVEPADPWKQLDDSFCGISIGLDAYLIAGSTDPIEAGRWLDAQSTALMGHPGVDVGDDVVRAVEVDPPFLFAQGNPVATFFACRIQFSRFIQEES